MSTARLRRATAQDQPALAALMTAAYAPYRADLRDLPDVAAGLAEDIARRIVWLALIKDEIVGGMILSAASDHLRLANIAVAQTARGQGIGRLLLAACEAEARQRSLPTLRLTTHAGMTRTLQMYRHLGWHETGRSGVKVEMSRKVAAL